MAGDIEAKGLFLESQRLLDRPFFDLWIEVPRLLRSFVSTPQQSKNIDLVALTIALERLADPHRFIQCAKHAGAGHLRRVEGAALDQTFNHPPVDRGQIDAPREIEQRIKRPILLAAL